MAKILIDCGELENSQDLEKAIDKILVRAKSCNVTYFRNAQARIESGQAKTKHEAAKQIADETGDSFETVRHRIRRGEKKVGLMAVPQTQPPPIGKFAFKLAQEIHDLKHKISSINQVLEDIPPDSLSPLVTALIQFLSEAILLIPVEKRRELIEVGKTISC